MRVITWNINGWKAMSNKPYLTELIAQYKPDLLCLQEIKVNEKDVVQLEGYECEYHFGEKRGYSGTAIFYKKPIEPIKVKRNRTEGRLLAFELDRFMLVNLYVPNSGENLRRLHPSPKFELSRLEWDAKLIEVLKKFKATARKPLLVVGDMNVARTKQDIKNASGNTRNAGFTQEERDSFENILSTVELRDVWREMHPDKVQYTYWSYYHKARERNSGWRIDYALLSKELRAEKCDILDHVMGSDHAPVLVDL